MPGKIKFESISSALLLDVIACKKVYGIRASDSLDVAANQL